MTKHPIYGTMKVLKGCFFMSKKIYNLNGEPISEEEFIDADYYEIQEEKKTGARKAKKIIAVFLLSAALASYGLAQQEATNAANSNTSETIAVVHQIPNKEEYQTLYTDIGEKYMIDELTIKEDLDNCNSCVVNGVYYSKVADELYSITVTRQYKETIEPMKSTIYVAPEGYVAIDNKGYKIPEDFDTTLGQDNTENYTENCVPTGYVLISNKIYKINSELFTKLGIDAVEVGLYEEIPEGYVEINIHQLNKKIGIKKEDYEKTIELEEKIIYSLPSGYLLERNTGVKTIKYKTEYLVTEEQYNNQAFSHLVDKKGEYIEHTITVVEARPMKELYDLLGIEYTESNKLTK